MIGTVRSAVVVIALGVRRVVIPVIPAARANIRTPDEGGVTVDDDEFLMMAGAQRVAVVKAELQPGVRRPVENILLPPLALERVDQTEIPGQDVNA